jgi:hypothetical protein
MGPRAAFGFGSDGLQDPAGAGKAVGADVVPVLVVEVGAYSRVVPPDVLWHRDGHGHNLVVGVLDDANDQGLLSPRSAVGELESLAVGPVH